MFLFAECRPGKLCRVESGLLNGVRCKRKLRVCRERCKLLLGYLVFDLYVIVPKDIDLSEITYKFSNAGKIYSAPIAQGSLQGSVEVWYGGKCLATVDLIARNYVAVATAKRVELSNQAEAGIVILMIVAVLVAFVAVVLHRQRVIARKRRAARRHTAERRR